MNKKEIKEIIKKELKEELKEINEISDHGLSKVYIVLTNKQKYILRINIDKNSIKNNFTSLKLIEKSKISPEPILFKKYGNFYLSLEKFLEGEKIDFRKDKNKKLIKHLVKPLKEIHKINNDKFGYSSGPKFGSWKAFLRKDIIESSGKKFLENLPKKEYIDFAFDNIPNLKTPVLLHGDFSFTNAIFNKRKVFLFDFEESFFGEKEFDLGLIYYMELFTEEFLDELVKSSGYEKNKIIFYAFLIGIKKVANSPKKKLKSRIEKLEKLRENLKHA